MNSFWDNSGVWTVIGALISVWTGIATGRYFAFENELQRARETILRLGDIFKVMHAGDNESEAMAQVAGLLLAPSVALQAQGHWGASSGVAKISQNAETTLGQCWREIRAGRNHLAQEAMERGFNQPSPPEVAAMGALVNTVMNKVVLCLQRNMTGIERLRPDWITIVVGSRIGFRIARCFAWTRWRYIFFTEHMETGAPICDIRARAVENERNERGLK